MVDSRNAKAKPWLIAACDSHEFAAQLLKESPDLLTAVDDTYQRTALHWATYYGQLKVVELLLRENVDLTNAVDNEGMIALHLAASERQRALAVPLLLAANPASLYALNTRGSTPLDIAIRADDVAIMAQFFAADPSLVHKAIDSEGSTTLHLAAKRGRFKIVEQLLDMDSQLIKAFDCRGRTAFAVALLKRWDVLDVPSDHERWAVLARFLTEDPSLSNRVRELDERRGTALHCVAQCGYAKGVAKLLAQHPDMVDVIDSEGRTALHFAAANGHSEVVAQLLAVVSPNTINAVSKNGETALLSARGHLDVVEQLLDVMSPDMIDAVDSQGRTALYWAVAFGMDKLVARLLAMSPGLIDKVTSEGETMLHVSAGCESIAEMFLALRPEMVHAVDRAHNTILHSAFRASKKFLERLLTLIPGAVHAVNLRRQTPFRLAMFSHCFTPHFDVLMVKLSLDEIMRELTACGDPFLKEELWRLVVGSLERQCECVLRDVLNQDVMGVVNEYIGLAFLKEPRHKKQRQR